MECAGADQSVGDAVMHTRGRIKDEMMTCGYRQEECGILVRTAYRVGTRVVCLCLAVPPPASAMTLLLRPSLDTRTRESKVLSISFSVSLNLSQSRLSGAAVHSALNPDPES